MSHHPTEIIHPVAPTVDVLPQLERNTYWHGKSMGVLEFQRDQTYVRQWVETLTRLTVGCGILCGLEVAPHGAKGLAVSAGAAVDGSGRLILVPQSVELEDPAPWLCPDREPAVPGRYRLCLIHHECPTSPAPVVVTGCDTTTRCLPGAVLERFRFELRPDAAACGSHGHPCRCREAGRSCESECDDCVVLATLTVRTDAIEGLVGRDRRLIASNAALTDQLGLGRDSDDRTDGGGPNLCRLWPLPGTTLSRVGSPSPWAEWRRRPRIELTFDQPVDVDRIDDPDDWIRAWVATEAVDEQGVRSVTFNRTGLTFLPDAGFRDRAEHRLVFEFRSRAAMSNTGRQVVLIQARANANTGPAAAAPAGRVAHIEYPGTPIAEDLLAAIWQADRFQTGDTTLDAIMAGPLPTCFGDDYDGGRLHAAFAVEPVEPADPLVTALTPTNGSRIGGDRIEIQLSATEPIAGLSPRAWIISGESHQELALTPRTLDDGETAAAFDRFPAGFDGTLAGELAATVAYRADTDGLSRGRVLVVVPAHTDEHPSVGAFAGTCLSDADAAAIHLNGLTPDHYHDIRPSTLRMPRSHHAGAWMHWTFFWERDHGVIS